MPTVLFLFNGVPLTLAIVPVLTCIVFLAPSGSGGSVPAGETA